MKPDVTINMNVFATVAASFHLGGFLFFLPTVRNVSAQVSMGLFVLILSGAGSVATQFGTLGITDLMTVVSEPTEFSSKKASGWRRGGWGAGGQ